MNPEQFQQLISAIKHFESVVGVGVICILLVIGAATIALQLQLKK